jgi:nucleoside-diphosphate-sugar epimerase
MIRLVDAGKLPGVPPGGGAFADVREVARAHVMAASQGASGESYLLGGEETTFMDLVSRTGKWLGKPTPTKPTPAWVLRAGAHASVAMAVLTRREPVLTPEAMAMLTHHVQVDSGKAQGTLAYRTTPMDKLVHDTCTWLRGEGLIG